MTVINMLMIELDIFSDTVCPWCYIGKKRLENALNKYKNLKIKQTWRPFQLNPGMPPDGMDRQEYLISKFGSSDAAKTVYENIYEEGVKEGINFNFDLIEVTPNSFNSHRLLALAYNTNIQEKVLDDLFESYFLHGKDIGDPNILLQIAIKHNIDAEEFKSYLSDQENIEPLANEEIQAKKMGINSIPTFIVNKQIVINGAQTSENFELIFEKLKARIN
jgi:predicted DsbA family dithiol-disulfide isomerase